MKLGQARRVVIYIMFGLALLLLAAPLRPGAVEESPANTGDFVPHLAAARLLAGNASLLYQPEIQFETEQILVSRCCPDYREYFLSPPFVALIYRPFLGLGLSLGQALWFFLSVGLLIGSLVLLRPVSSTGLRDQFLDLVITFLAAWPTVELLLIRQDSAIALFLLVAGLRLLLARRDGLAGAVLGLGLYKPQLFLMVPALLAAQQRWKALGAWLLTAGGLAALSVALVGLPGIRDYLSLLGSPASVDLMQDRSWQMVSLAALVRGLLGGSDVPVTTLATYSLPLLVLGWFIALVRKPGRSARQFSLMYCLAVVGSILATPYAYEYDAVVLVIPIALFGDDPPTSALVGVGYVLACASLLRDLIFHGGAVIPVPFLPLAILALFVMLTRRFSRPGDEDEVGPQPVVARAEIGLGRRSYSG